VCGCPGRVYDMMRRNRLRANKIKLIILDEADALTNDSQYALRRIIDDYSHSTRFIIICNYLNKLINPIISRFRCFQFKQISLDSIFSDCTTILFESLRAFLIVISSCCVLLKVIDNFKFFKSSLHSILVAINSFSLVKERNLSGMLSFAS
jgi:hypothetical protein